MATHHRERELLFVVVIFRPFPERIMVMMMLLAHRYLASPLLLSPPKQNTITSQQRQNLKQVISPYFPPCLGATDLNAVVYADVVMRCCCLLLLPSLSSRMSSCCLVVLFASLSSFSRLRTLLNLQRNIERYMRATSVAVAKRSRVHNDTTFLSSLRQPVCFFSSRLYLLGKLATSHTPPPHTANDVSDVLWYVSHSGGWPRPPTCQKWSGKIRMAGRSTASRYNSSARGCRLVDFLWPGLTATSS